MLAQLLNRPAAGVVDTASNQHVGRGHFGEVGDVFLQILERVFDVQRKQAAQTGLVFGSGHVRLVKNFNADSVLQVNQRREADQDLTAFVDFHQLGQLAEGPGGVALASRIRGRFRRT